MPERIGWSRDQLIIAMKLYCELPFGRMHSRNPEVIRYAALIGRTPSAVAMKLTNLASLDPRITSTGRKGLTGASDADRKMWKELSSDWTQFAAEVARVDNELGAASSTTNPIEDLPDDSIDYSSENRKQLINARVRQGFFRSTVLSSYQFRCCISGLGAPEMLVASHIVPWSLDPQNRLNPRNGLCLSSIHDRAFDLGLITVSADLRVIVSNRLLDTVSQSCFKEAFHPFVNKAISLPAKFQPAQEFLEYHRSRIFVEAGT